MAKSLVFLPGDESSDPIPLARFLPPVNPGVVGAWLGANAEKGDWILDPFGGAPQLVVEAASAGYRVAVAANNPIVRFLLDALAQPPTVDELRSALADLAAVRRGDERLEPHILELYQTRCPQCNELLSAEAFVWDREAGAPTAKIVDCPHCEHAGESETSEEDRERAAAYQAGGPNRARALERIAPRDDPDRKHAEEALEAYLPRAVYALFTILNRMESLSLDEPQRRALTAMLLNVLDRGNTLWAHPSGRTRPKQLGAPPQFREHNIWRELERSVDLWARGTPGIRVVAWPEDPGPEGGISVYEGRLREMAENLSQMNFRAIVSALPRPNQAYWTLSALWAGWLWGREAIGPFSSVLRRRRYDWSWHCQALSASLQRLADVLPQGIPFFGIISESEAGFNAAALTAANLSGFKLEGLALRRDQAELQAQWSKADLSPDPEEDIAAAIAERAQKLLEQRGEPSHFLHLQAAGLGRLSQRKWMGSQLQEAGELYSEIKSEVEVALTFRSGFLRFGGSEKSVETGQWWLREGVAARDALADRVEIALVRYLVRNPGLSAEQIDAAICVVFPGLLTPPRSLVLDALDSYGQESDGLWELREEDQPRARRDDLRELRDLVRTLGTQFGYEVSANPPIEWRDENGELVFSFRVIASAVITDLLLQNEDPAEKSVLVLPGGRARLVLNKVGRDARLKQALQDGWHLVKFRHLRRLAENHSLTPQSFRELLDLDPLSEDQAQAPLL